jgi:hypothetical protein
MMAREACDTLGLEIDTTPAEALLRDVRETAGNVEFYRSEVARLATHPEDDEYVEGDGGKGHWERGETGVYGRTYHQSGVPTGEGKAHILVQLYNDERKHLLAVTSAALKANVDERQVRVMEQYGEQLASSLGFVLEAFGLRDDPRAPDVVRQALAMLGAGDVTA